MRPILVSACLVGRRCRHDGDHCEVSGLREKLLISGCEIVALCPEEAGGLPTPRFSARIVGGGGGPVIDGKARVLCLDGTDVTRAFVRGAEEAARLASVSGAGLAILKDRSPSCGVREIWREGGVVAGEGVTTALLRRRGVRVMTADEWSVDSDSR